MTTATSLTIGSTVRVQVQVEGRRVLRRGIIATIQEDATASVLLEEPRPPASSSFVVAGRPNNNASDSQEEDELEVTLPFSEVMPLLEFEQEELNDSSLTANDWKDRGDQLLKLGDALAAMEFYQKGLQSTSHVSIGSTVIIKQKGFTKLAEIDCVESDGSLDVSLLEDGTELTIKLSEVLLGIMRDDSDRIQERMLLNMARCCLQAAEIVAAKQRTNFIRRAVLTCTLAMDVSRADDSSEGGMAASSATTKTALVLRSKAQCAVFKFDHAKADLKRLLSMDPTHAEGKRLMQELERTIQNSKKSHKKLVKELCKWVDVATSQSTQL